MKYLFIFLACIFIPCHAQDLISSGSVPVEINNAMSGLDYMQLAQDWSLAFFSVLFFFFFGKATGAIVNAIKEL